MNRLDHLTDQGTSLFFFHWLTTEWSTDKEDGDDFSKQERLEKLASFQLMMIRHAMKCECPSPDLETSIPVHSGALPACYRGEQLRVAVLYISDVVVGMFQLSVSACHQRPMLFCSFPSIRVVP